MPYKLGILRKAVVKRSTKLDICGVDTDSLRRHATLILVNRGVAHSLGIPPSYKPQFPPQLHLFHNNFHLTTSTTLNTKQEQQLLLVLLYINHFYLVTKCPDQILLF